MWLSGADAALPACTMLVLQQGIGSGAESNAQVA